MTPETMAGGEPPKPSTDAIRRALAHELSTAARAGYTLLLLTSVAATTVIAALLATEPTLPTRTTIALTVLVGIGLSWAAFAAWALTRRRVLFVPHRVVAARMAVVFSALFSLGTLLVGPQWIPGWYWALAVGLGMCGVAVAMLVSARRQFQQLTARRQQLEAALAGRGGAR